MRLLLQMVGIMVAAVPIAFLGNEYGAKYPLDINKQYYQLEAERLANGLDVEGQPLGGSQTHDETDSTSSSAGTSAKTGGTAAPGDSTDAATPEVLAAPQLVGGMFPLATLADVKDAVDADFAVLVDARRADLYTDGHIPGAYNLDRFGNIADALVAEGLVERFADAAMVIVYCNGGDCEDSINLALELTREHNLSPDNTYVFKAGYEAWTKAGLRIVEGEDRR